MAMQHFTAYKIFQVTFGRYVARFSAQYLKVMLSLVLTPIWKTPSNPLKERGVSEKLLIKGSATKKPSDWKQFLLNGENKKQFTNILLTEWQKNTYASELHGRRVILIFDGKAYVLSSDDGIQVKMSVIPGVCSSQEETDTRIILYVAYAQSKGYRYARVRSPDSDIFFIMLHYANMYPNIIMLFDTGKGNNKKLLNITEMAMSFSQVHCSALLGLHAFTGCDSTSAMKGRGKVRPLGILQVT